MRRFEFTRRRRFRAIRTFSNVNRYYQDRSRLRLYLFYMIVCMDMASKQCVESTSRFEVSSPLGNIIMEICIRGLHTLSQCHSITDENFDPNLRQPICLVEKPQPCNEAIMKHATDSVNWLNAYFNEQKSPLQQNLNKDLSLPSFCFMESGEVSFRERVWLKLAENVGPGQTITYGSLAALVDSPGAARAVGTAMAQNPFQLIVPCHRVIRSDLNVGKYASGCKNNVKLWLLKYEGVAVDNKGCVIHTK